MDLNSHFKLIEITNLSTINQFWVYELITPLIIKFSSDSKFLAILGITSRYQSAIFFMDPFIGKKLAVISFAYSLCFKIKDLSFRPQTNDEFITMGVQHASKWKYKAGSLEF